MLKCIRLLILGIYLSTGIIAGPTAAAFAQTLGAANEAPRPGEDNWREVDGEWQRWDSGAWRPAEKSAEGGWRWKGEYGVWVGDGTAPPIRDAIDEFAAGEGACWTCDFIGTAIVIFDAGAKSVFSLLAEPLREFLSYVFIVWIGLQALKLFFPFDNSGGILRSIVLRSIVFMVVILATTELGRGLYFEWIYNPAIHFGSAGASAILDQTSILGADAAALFGATSGEFNLLVGRPDIPAGMAGISDADVTGVLRMIEAVQRMCFFVFGVVWSAFTNLGVFDFAVNFFPVLLSLIAGLLLFAIYGLILFAFAFYVLDLFLRIAIISSLAPLLIGGYLMKPTRGMAIQALQGILGSMLVLIAAAIVFSLGAAFIMVVPSTFVNESGQALKSYAELQTLMASESRGLSFGDTGYWLLLMAGLFMNAAMSKAKGIVESTFGGFSDGPSMGEKISGLGAAGVSAVASGGLAAATMLMTRKK